MLQHTNNISYPCVAHARPDDPEEHCLGASQKQHLCWMGGRICASHMSIKLQCTDANRDQHAASGMANMMDLLMAGVGVGVGVRIEHAPASGIKHQQSQSGTGATSLTPLGNLRCGSNTVWPRLRPLMSTSMVAGMASPGHKHSTVRRIK